MNFKRIFTKDIDCKLWSVCYPEHGRGQDIFRLLFNKWSDTEYLFNFFVAHESELNFYYNGLEIEDAIDQVQYEAIDFENLIRCIQKKVRGYENRTIQSIFMPLHKGVYALQPDKIDQKKSKPKIDSMLRLYAVNLDDALIITGGAIKIVHEMRGTYLQPELDNLKRVQDYFKSEGIYNVTGFDDY